MLTAQIRKFDHCRDDEALCTYLTTRSISLGFLREIDQFFQGHPEIATCAEGRSTLRQLSTLPPLEAYKYFLKVRGARNHLRCKTIC